MVFEANSCNKTEHTMRKGMENCASKWCLFLCTILFGVTWRILKDVFSLKHQVISKIELKF